jgi:hypothetical protein
LTEAPGEQGIDVIGLVVPCVPLPVNAVPLVIADIWYLQCHCHSGFKFLLVFFPSLILIAFLVPALAQNMSRQDLVLLFLGIGKVVLS